MTRLQEKFNKEIIPAMKEAFGYKNDLVVPRLQKVKINAGLSVALSKEEKYRDTVIETLKRITGQKPLLIKAKKSISAFKVRQGMVVGASVTLRGQRMYEFVDKLVNITLARVRDFQGIEEKSLGNSGSFTLGFKEHIVFPEIKSDEVERIHGLEVSVITNAKTKAEGLKLFKLLGFPFKEKPSQGGSASGGEESK
ncbi:MAG: 50S ribosomal protein L5 [Patescibacteria group bacterium]